MLLSQDFPTAVLGLYAGPVAPLAGGRASAIHKLPVTGEVALNELGLHGDAQADRRLHGGPDKALHHFPSEHYPALARVFPAIGELLAPGSIGENISSLGLTEKTVCLGDVFSLGTARVQLSQPRSPCAKIDRRYGVDGLAKYLQQHGSCGWYYRVLNSGVVRAGDSLLLLEREPDAVSLALFHTTMAEPRPPRDLLERLSNMVVLGPDWIKKLRGRLQWLTRQSHTKK
jgi:MOSC domain-containing protein YiiM